MSDPPRPEEIEALLADFQRSGLRELHLRSGDFELYLSAESGASLVALGEGTGGAPAPAEQETPAEEVAPAAAPVDLPEGAVLVRAPYLGTFYRAPKPGAPVYVDPGSAVTPETELCLVEVMKLFTSVRSPVTGTVHAILASDGQMVEADQPLFAILPA